MSPTEINPTKQHTKDLELCLDGGTKGRTLVGDSFSMECRLCVDCRLSGCVVAETGRNFGGAGEIHEKTVGEGPFGFLSAASVLLEVGRK